MELTVYNFDDLMLDYSNNFFNTLYFSYNDIQYKFNLFVIENSLYLSSDGSICIPRVNKIFKHKDFNYVFMQENQKDDNDLDIKTIFNKYKIGIINEKS